MKLNELNLRNFRQFYGVAAPIRFAAGERNVTIIIGTNGGGKTTILNAFTWLLFNEVTPAFEMPDDLVNHRAIFELKNGEKVSAAVALTFEHDGYQYRIERKVDATRDGSSRGYHLGPELPAKLSMCGPDGEWKSRQDVEDCIGRILPRELHSFFFFDGERIEHIVRANKGDRENIARATKMLIGVEIFDRAVAHLGHAQKVLEEEWAAVSGTDVQGLIAEKEKFELERSDLGVVKETHERNLDGFRVSDDAISDRLRALHEVRHLQERRDELEADEEALRQSILQTIGEMREIVSRGAYVAFLNKPFDAFSAMVEQLRERGELPSGIKRQFVDDLLENGRCICKRVLSDEDGSRAAVQDWMSKAGLADVEESAIRMGGEIRTLRDQAPVFWSRLERAQGQMATARQQLHSVEEQLEKISAELKNSPKEEVAKLEERSLDLKSKMQEEIESIAGINYRLKQIEQALSELEEKIGRHRAKESRERLAQRRVQVARDASDRIRQYRDNLAREFREDLQKRVQDLFSKISFKPYQAVMTDDYHLKLVAHGADGASVSIGKSTGENQILSLAFIGSIIALCRDFTARRENLALPDSSQFPIVMDSPFGSLVGSYREQIAQHLPLLANQVVILVSQKQWQDEVEQSIAQVLGRVYLLQYESTKSAVSKETVMLRGKGYDLVRESVQGYEYTEIVEVGHV